MNFKIIIVLIIFLSTYALSTISVLYTESFILFLSAMVIFIVIMCTSGFTFNYNKDDFKWNETIRFYLSLKNWHRAIIRDYNIKMVNFLLLSIQIQKYEIEWLKRNIEKITRRDYILLTNTTLKRLEILSYYKNLMKSESTVSGLRRLPIIPAISSFTKKNEIYEKENLYEKQLKETHPMYYELIYKQQQQ
jgi:hypothetical protein